MIGQQLQVNIPTPQKKYVVEQNPLFFFQSKKSSLTFSLESFGNVFEINSEM